MNKNKHKEIVCSWINHAKRDLEAARILHRGIRIDPVMEAASLTDYAVETRYPDFDLEPTMEEASEAITIAEKTLDWVLQRLEGMGIQCQAKLENK